LRLRGVEPHPGQEPTNRFAGLVPRLSTTISAYLWGFHWPFSGQGHRGGRPSVSAAVGVGRSDGVDRQRHCECPAVFLQAHAESPRSCRRGRVGPQAAPPPGCSQPGRGQSAARADDEHQAQGGSERDSCHRPAVIGGRIAQTHRHRQRLDRVATPLLVRTVSGWSVLVVRGLSPFFTRQLANSGPAYDLRFLEHGFWAEPVPRGPLAEYRVHRTSMMQISASQPRVMHEIMRDVIAAHPWLRLVDGPPSAENSSADCQANASSQMPIASENSRRANALKSEMTAPFELDREGTCQPTRTLPAPRLSNQTLRLQQPEKEFTSSHECATAPLLLPTIDYAICCCSAVPRPGSP
jgi:hypothetical protein